MRSWRARLAKVLISRRFVAWVVLLGFALRVAWAIIAGDARPFYDSDSYIKIADNLLRGQGFLWGDQRLGRPPLYPMLVAATRFGLFGRQFLALYLAQAALGAASVWLFAAGARRLINKVAGGVTAVILTLDPFLIFFCGTVLSETLFIFFLAVCFFAVMRSLDGPRLQYALLSGVAAGCSFLTRPSMPGVLAVFALALCVWARPRLKGLLSALVTVLVCALVVLPWGLRNYRLTGHWVFTTLGVGASLYDGVGPQADGSSNMDFLRSSDILAMDEYARDRYLLGRAYDAIVDDPVRVVKLMGVKALRFWSPAPRSEGFRSPAYEAAGYAAVLPVYAMALVAMFSGVARRRDFFVLAGPPVYFTLVHMVFVGSLRYRVPVMPFVSMLAAAWVSAFLAGGMTGLGGRQHAKWHFPRQWHMRTKKREPHKRRGLTLPFRLFLLFVTLAVLAGAVGYAYYRRWLANPENVRALAVREIGLLFPGKTIKVSHAEFALTAGLDLFGVEVLETADAPVPIAKLDHAHIDFDRRRLARLKLAPRSITASDLFVDLVRDTQGKWNLALPLAEARTGPASETIAGPFTLSLLGAFVSLDDKYSGYSLSFPVERAIASSEGTDLTQWRLALGFGASLMGKWVVNGRGDTQARELDVKFGVVDIDLGEGLGSRLPPAAREGYETFNPSGPADVSGEVTYSTQEGWDFTIEGRLKACGLRHRDFPVQVTGIFGTMRFAPGGCSFEEVAGKTLGGDVKFTGMTKGYGGEAAFAVEITAANVRTTEEFLNALRASDRGNVEMFAPDGVFNVDATLDRPPGPAMPLDISYDAYPKKIKAVYRDFPYPLEDVSGHVSYAKHHFDIDGLTGRHGPAKVVITGTADAAPEGLTADVRVIGRGVPLDDTLRDLLPEKAVEAWKALAATGEADVDVTIAKAPGTPADVKLSADVRNAAVNYERFPYRLSGGTGKVTLAGRTLKIENCAFSHGQAQASIDGEVDTSTGQLSLEVSARRLAVDGEFVRALPREARRFFERIQLAATADAEISMARGADGEVTIGPISAVMRGGQFMLPQLPLGIGAAEADFNYSQSRLDVVGLDGILVADNSLALLPVVRLAMASRPATPIEASGVVPLAGETDWTMHFKAEDFFLDDAVLARLPQAAREFAEAGGAAGLANVTGSVGYREGPPVESDYEFILDCRDARLAFEREIRDIRGRIDLVGGTSGTRTEFAVGAKLDSLQAAGRQFGATELELEKTPDGTIVRSFKAEFCGGTLTGQGRIEQGEKKGYAFTATASGVDLKRALEGVFAARKNDFTGRLDGKMKFWSPTGRAKDLIGSVDAQITKGRLWDVPVVFAVLNVLQLKSPERSQFDSAHVAFDVSQGEMLVREFSMSSDAATLFGKGEVDLDGEVDLLFYSRPGKIPVISLIAGEVGRNIVRARVTGTFAKPQVRLVPSGFFSKVLQWTRGGGGED